MIARLILLKNEGTAHPEHELLYSVTDSESSLVLVHPKYEAVMAKVAEAAKLEMMILRDEDMDISDETIPEVFDMELTRRALIIFTSGTTGMN
jgi:malonyl-CoA/methylmalonyl-CoA synthetase